MVAQTSLGITSRLRGQGSKQDCPVQMARSPSAWTRGLPGVKADTLTFIVLVLCPFIPES